MIAVLNERQPMASAGAVLCAVGSLGLCPIAASAGKRAGGKHLALCRWP
jgi:hypothetical protein